MSAPAIQDPAAAPTPPAAVRRSAPDLPPEGADRHHTVEFVDEIPPAPRRTTTEENAAFAAELRRHPLRWAIYPYGSELAQRTRKQRVTDINRHHHNAPTGMRKGFEAALRGEVMYIRFVGGAR